MDRPQNSGTIKGVTLQDVAKRCGVSLASTSYALAGDRVHVSEETSQRIIATAREMGYDPSRYQAARRLVSVGSGREIANNIVALYVPPEFHETRYHLLVFSGVMAEMMPRSYGVLTLHGYAPGRHYILPKPIVQGDVDAVIMAVHSYAIDAIYSELRSEPSFGRRPVVSVLEKIEGVSSVTADDYQGGFLAISHLLDLGHRYFMHFGIYYEQLHCKRLEGYRAALSARGLDPDTHLVQCDWTAESLAESEQNLRRELENHPNVTALLAYSDESALLIAETLRMAGLRIPEDISLVGFDGTHELRDEHGNNILTTITVPLFEIGRLSADMVLRHQAERPDTPEDIVLPVSLTTRGSTAPPRS